MTAGQVNTHERAEHLQHDHATSIDYNSARRACRWESYAGRKICQRTWLAIHRCSHQRGHVRAGAHGSFMRPSRPLTPSGYKYGVPQLIIILLPFRNYQEAFTRNNIDHPRITLPFPHFNFTIHTHYFLFYAYLSLIRDITYINKDIKDNYYQSYSSILLLVEVPKRNPLRNVVWARRVLIYTEGTPHKEYRPHWEPSSHRVNI